MPYYSITVRETRPGSKLRRKMAIEAANRETAKAVFTERSAAIEFSPDFSTLKEITPVEFHRIIKILLGKGR